MNQNTSNEHHTNQPQAKQAHRPRKFETFVDENEVYTPVVRYQEETPLERVASEPGTQIFVDRPQNGATTVSLRAAQYIPMPEPPPGVASTQPALNSQLARPLYNFGPALNMVHAGSLMWSTPSWASKDAANNGPLASKSAHWVSNLDDYISDPALRALGGPVVHVKVSVPSARRLDGQEDKTSNHDPTYEEDMMVCQIHHCPRRNSSYQPMPFTIMPGEPVWGSEVRRPLSFVPWYPSAKRQMFVHSADIKAKEGRLIFKYAGKKHTTRPMNVIPNTKIVQFEDRKDREVAVCDGESCWECQR